MAPMYSDRARSASSAESSWAQGLLTLLASSLVRPCCRCRKVFRTAMTPAVGVVDLAHGLTAFMFITGSFYDIITIKRWQS